MAIAQVSVVNNAVAVEVSGTALLAPLVSAAAASAAAAAASAAEFVGSVAMLFRTGASTANALVTVTEGGDLGSYRVSDLFLCPMSVSNTSATVTLDIDGIGVKPVVTSRGDPLPVPAWGELGVVALRYRSDVDKFYIAFTNYTVSPDDVLLPAKVPSYRVAATAVSDGGDTKKLLLTPLTPLPNSTLANTRIDVVFPDDRPADVGMQIKVIGFNDAEYVQLRDSDVTSQVANDRWSANDTGEIARDATTGLLYLVRVDRRVLDDAATGALSFYQQAAAKGAAERAATADRLARRALAKPFGFETGAGGAVTQATSKSTGVTLNKLCGRITLNAASLAAGAAVAFTLTNSEIAADDIVLVTIKSGATAAGYDVQVEATAAGSCSISIRNRSGGALAEAVVLNFTVIKSVAA